MLGWIDGARHRTLYALLTLAYLGLALPWLSLPGLYHDEVFFAPAAIEIIKGDLGLDYQFRSEPFVWEVGGHKLPLMGLDYSSALKAYLYVPFFLLLGYGPWAARLTSVLVGLLGVLWTYRFARSCFDKRTGFVAALILAVDPSYLWFCRVDYGLVPIHMACKMGALASGILWWRSGRTGDAFLALLLAGLGLSSRADFLWMIAAVGLALLVNGRMAFWGRLRVRSVAVGLAGFAAGASAFLVWNLYHRGQIFGIWLRTLRSDNETWLPDSPLTSASALWDAIAMKASALGRVLMGIYHGHMFNDRTPDWMATYYPITRAWPLWVYGVAGIVLLVLAFGAREQVARRKIRALVVVMLAIFAQIVFTPNATGGHHAIMLYPMLQMGLALVLIRFPDYLPPWWKRLRPLTRRWGLVTVLGLGVLAFTYGTEHARTFSGLLATGGTGHWSDSVYDLAAWAREHPETEIVQMDMSFASPLLFLTAGETPTIRGYAGYEDRTGRIWDPEKRSYIDPRMYRYFTRENAVFLLRDPCCVGYYGPRNVFFATVRASGADLTEVGRFEQRDGQAVAVLLRVELPPVGPPGQPPAEARDGANGGR